jgi:hypothetical protein
MFLCISAHHIHFSGAFLSANARIASLTQAPSSWARMRASIRSLLHGPLPWMTCQNSSQLIGPNRQFPVDGS